MTKKGFKKTKRKIHIKRLILTLLTSLGLCTGVLYGMHQYAYPTLYGTWQSTVTSNTVTFKEDGTVILENEATLPAFEKISDSRMYYTIDGKSFEMHYTLDGRDLYWGMHKEHLEHFIRK